MQDWLAEGRRCGPLIEATTAQIQALPQEQLEGLAVGEAFSARVAQLDVHDLADLAAWLAAPTTTTGTTCSSAPGENPKRAGGAPPPPPAPARAAPSAAPTQSVPDG